MREVSGKEEEVRGGRDSFRTSVLFLYPTRLKEGGGVSELVGQ